MKSRYGILDFILKTYNTTIYVLIFLVFTQLTSAHGIFNNSPEQKPVELLTGPNLCYKSVETSTMNQEPIEHKTEEVLQNFETQHSLYTADVQNTQNYNTNQPNQPNQPTNFSLTPSNKSQSTAGNLQDQSAILDMIRMRSRTNIPPEKTAILEKVFSVSPFPTNQEKANLAQITGLPAKVIGVWFQNKRQRIRKECPTTEKTMPANHF